MSSQRTMSSVSLLPIFPLLFGHLYILHFSAEFSSGHEFASKVKVTTIFVVATVQVVCTLRCKTPV